MQNTCSQVLTISPELKTIFAGHFQKRYQLVWFKPFINKWRGRKTIAKKISERFEDVANKNDRYFARNNQRKLMAGNDKFRFGARRFIKDFLALSHSDVDVLLSMTIEESLGIKEADTYRIGTIKNKPFNYQEV